MLGVGAVATAAPTTPYDDNALTSCELNHYIHYARKLWVCYIIIMEPQERVGPTIKREEPKEIVASGHTEVSPTEGARAPSHPVSICATTSSNAFICSNGDDLNGRLVEPNDIVNVFS